MNNHTHEFGATEKYIFEDVLVAEEIKCVSEFCDAVEPIQYEVNFTSFTRNGKPVDESQAKSIWEALCGAYGPEIKINREKLLSDGIKIENLDGTEFVFKYNGKLDEVETTLDGDSIRFTVEYYRKLSVKNC
jgi:hypothetical protein